MIAEQVPTGLFVAWVMSMLFCFTILGLVARDEWNASKERHR